jgi:hypothetical protein
MALCLAGCSVTRAPWVSTVRCPWRRRWRLAGGHQSAALQLRRRPAAADTVSSHLPPPLHPPFALVPLLPRCLQDLISVRFMPVPDGGPNEHMDPVTKDVFTNASRLVVLKPTGGGWGPAWGEGWGRPAAGRSGGAPTGVQAGLAPACLPACLPAWL